MDAKNKETLQFLETLRYIAQQGLHYNTGDTYDRDRYQTLLTLASEAYGLILETPPSAVLQQLQAELGHITPKVGVDGALFNDRGEILLIQRADDQCWGLPCGWCDVNESPETALARELHEEIGWQVTVKEIVNVFTRLPGEYGALSTSYHMVYLCEPPVPEPEPQLAPHEVLQTGWFDLNAAATAQLPWHREHEGFARAAFSAWQAKQAGLSASQGV